MKKHPLIGTVIMLLCFGLPIHTSDASAAASWEGSIAVLDGAEVEDLARLLKLPKVAVIEQAALAAIQDAVPKKAIEAELEVEEGYLIFQVEVVVRGEKSTVLHSVLVDAGNAKVLAVEREEERKWPAATKVDPVIPLAAAEEAALGALGKDVAHKQVTEIELELVGDHLVVEVEVVTVDEDKVWRVFVDSKTGKVLQAEEKSED